MMYLLIRFTAKKGVQNAVCLHQVSLRYNDGNTIIKQEQK